MLYSPMRTIWSALDGHYLSSVLKFVCPYGPILSPNKIIIFKHKEQNRTRGRGALTICSIYAAQQKCYEYIACVP